MGKPYKYSERSLQNLATCHPLLRELFLEVIKHHDCSILCGWRTKEDQDRLYHEGRSKLRFPQSKHNRNPSLAIDVAPYPIDWGDSKRWFYFAGLVKGIAAGKNIQIRWGGDWDRDNNFYDQSFNDWPHFELIE